ncbi:hypothetical protein ACOCTW_004883, partial [Escherichia coli]
MMLYAKKADTSDEPVTVPGDLHRGGSVFGRKRRVGAKSWQAGSTAGENGCNSRKGKEKIGFIAATYVGKS